MGISKAIYLSFCFWQKTKNPIPFGFLGTAEISLSTNRKNSSFLLFSINCNASTTCRHIYIYLYMREVSILHEVKFVDGIGVKSPGSSCRRRRRLRCIMTQLFLRLRLSVDSCCCCCCCTRSRFEIVGVVTAATAIRRVGRVNFEAVVVITVSVIGEEKEARGGRIVCIKKIERQDDDWRGQTDKTDRQTTLRSLCWSCLGKQFSIIAFAL